MQLFSEQKNCCCCGACENICPTNAITLEENEQGFIYPSINKDKCVECGKCQNVCQYKCEELIGKRTKNVYAAISIDDELTKYSSSAGVFAIIAKWVLEQNGVVCGVALEKKEGEKLENRHVFIEDIANLHLLQGSKYIQSNVGNCYKRCEEYLKDGRLVLFSGTPCQVAGMKLFLGKEYNNLITMDIVCHGVPSQKMFLDYLLELEKKNGIIDRFRFRFRDWEKDTGHNFQYLSDSRGKKKLHSESGYCSSYYKFFLDGVIYRDSCYDCYWAKNGFERVGDVTICDYWGFKKVHPEFVKGNSLFDSERRVSGIMINSTKGEIVKQVKDDLILMASSEDKIKKYNPVLRNPTICPQNRKKIMDLYVTSGYSAVEKEFYRQRGIEYYMHKFFYRLPRKVKSVIRKIM